MAKDVNKRLETLSEKVEEIKQKAKKWESQAEDKIREHPVQSVLVSFGAGLLAGAILTALMRRK